MTNANRFVSTVNARLFPVELMEIADWKSMSEYMLHSNFGKTLTKVNGGNLYCRFPISYISVYLFRSFINGKKI